MTQPYYFFLPPQHYESLQFGSSSSVIAFPVVHHEEPLWK